MFRLIAFSLALYAPAFGAVPLVSFAALGSSTIRAGAVDATGNVYVTGTTYSSFTSAPNSFPATAGAFQKIFNGSGSCVSKPFLVDPRCKDAFVAKFTSAGALVYASYLGGSDYDEGFAIAVDQAGDTWVTGYTYSNDFPVTANALQKKNGGGAYFATPTNVPPYEGDAFLAEVNADGTALLYSSFLGGSGPDVANTVAIDSQGSIYLAGETQSSDFPTTAISGQGGGFAAKFDPAAPAMQYSTYFDSPVMAIAVDAAGNAYVTGSVSGKFSTTPGAFQTAPGGFIDAFVAKLSPDGATRLYATLLGGSSDDFARGIAVDAGGDAWVVGSTFSKNFPVTAPAASRSGGGFLARINPSGSALVFSALVAGSNRFDSSVMGNSYASSVLLDASGDAWVSGNFIDATPVLTPDALEKTACGNAGFQDFIMKWSPQGTLLYSSYSREGPLVAMDGAGNLYLVRSASDYTSIVFRLDPNADQIQSFLACMTNSASFTFLGVAPGEIVSLFGDRLGPDRPVSLTLDSTGKAATTLGSTRVLFDGTPAPLIYAAPDQINAIAPWGLTQGKSTSVVVEYSGVPSVSLTVPVVAADPGVFKIQPSVGTTQGAILNQDGSLNSARNPAAAGSVISIYCTGTGLLNPAPQDGEIVQDAFHLLQTPVQVSFSGPATGEVLYAGAAPALVAGVTQINVRLPNTQAPGTAGIILRIGNGLLSSVLATVAVN